MNAEHAQEMEDLLARQLSCMQRLARMCDASEMNIETMLRQTVATLASAWREPEHVGIRATLHGQAAATPGYRDTPWSLRHSLRSNGQVVGDIAVSYHEEPPGESSQCFLRYEEQFLDGVAEQLGHTLEQMHAMRCLHESEERHRAIAESAQDAIITADAEGVIRFWNPAAERMFGFSESEAVGVNMLELIVPPQYHAAERRGLAHFAATGCGEVVGKMLELTALRRDGTEFSVELSLSHYESTKGHMAVALIRDVTLRKETERALREARDKAEAFQVAKSEFLTNMSHEIRTPLTAILGFMEILAGEGICCTCCEALEVCPTRKKTLEYIQTVMANAQALLHMVEDVLDLSSLEGGRRQAQCEPVSTCELVAQVLSVVRARAHAKGLQLEVAFTGPVPAQINTDEYVLRTVLSRLLTKAIWWTEQGRVRFVTQLVQDGAGTPALQFDVIDSGLGMTEQQAEHLFEPYASRRDATRRAYDGTGLGLVIVKQLVDLLGGKVCVVETRPGYGTCVRVTVGVGCLADVEMLDDPASIVLCQHSENEHCPVNDERLALGCRILVAEDGPDNQRLIAHVLRKVGADVSVVANGREAEIAVLAAQSTGTPFNVVLMDMQMPEMDGYTATRRLREHGVDIPVVALTACAMADDRAKCLEAGCNEYISKPINRTELIDAVRRFVAEERPEPLTEAV